MKAVVAAFNQEKALVGAFSVIVQLHRLIVYSTSENALSVSRFVYHGRSVGDLAWSGPVLVFLARTRRPDMIH